MRGVVGMWSGRAGTIRGYLRASQAGVVPLRRMKSYRSHVGTPTIKAVRPITCQREAGVSRRQPATQASPAPMFGHAP